MKKTICSAILAVFTISVLSISSIADPGDLFVQIDFDGEGNQTECSILKVDPDGVLSEFVSNSQIIAATGQTGADCDNTAMVCSDNGDIYFSEDFDEDDPGNTSKGKIVKATPGGDVTLFVSNADIIAVTGDPPGDLDKALAFGPDGNLYAGDDSSDSILKFTVPGGEVSIEITEDEIAEATGLGGADLEGGIAIDRDFNFYIAEDDSDSIVTCRPGGNDCRVLTTEAQIQAATGTNVDLDEAIIIGRLLYVTVDSCDCIVRIDPSTGVPELFVTEDQIANATGNAGADPEGGIALDQNAKLYIGDDSGPGGNILRSNASGRIVDVFVSDTELINFYSSIAPGLSTELDGGMCIEGVNLERVDVPTLSEWSMLAMAGVLGVIGLLFVMRRRALSS